ncbi:MAG: hypothetical protein ABSH22_18505 [Tepidisphaeraceae bacterium]|jgi:hypothetical protein
MNQHAVPNAVTGLPGKPTNGGSSPRFYDFDDGVVRLVKWHPCPHGSKGCFNELVASRLGQLIDSPILRGSIVYVPDDIIPADHRPIGRAGFHFAVTRMRGENFLPAQHYAEIENSAQLAAAAIHLAWLHVEDQQSHNQFLQRLETGGPNPAADSDRRLFRLIDMGFMFGNANWDAARVALLPQQYVLPRHLADKLTMTVVDSAIAALHAIPDANIRACFDDVPPEWTIPAADTLAAAARSISIRATLRQIIVSGNPDLATRV